MYGTTETTFILLKKAVSKRFTLLTCCIAAYAIWRKIGFKWSIPAILEILFLIAMVGATNDLYVPHLTAFMGLTISWLCLLWAMGYKWIPSKSKLGKLVSEFIQFKFLLFLWSEHIWAGSRRYGTITFLHARIASVRSTFWSSAAFRLPFRLGHGVNWGRSCLSFARRSFFSASTVGYLRKAVLVRLILYTFPFDARIPSPMH